MSKEIQKWADPAMFTAEPLRADEGPKVYLLSMTPDPLGSVAAACKMYKGEVVRNLASITDDERRDYFLQVQKTKLQAPFEYVDFHFMIEGVTRSFTHQMVRQRTAVYAQESLRFAVKEDMAEGVALPPSLAGTEGTYREETQKILDSANRMFGPLEMHWEDGKAVADNSAAEAYLDQASRLDEKERMRAEWDKANEAVAAAYRNLIESGMPAEDARGLLPHNITTRLHYKTNLRSLLDHAGNRLCTQAQFEWRAVFARIIEAIRDAPRSCGRSIMLADAWQFEMLSTIFKPICYQTGKCEFKADFDRKCKIRDRVDAFHKHGIGSEEWSKGHKFPAHRMPFDQTTSDIPWFERNPDTGQVRDIIPPISPVEWIADPGAAR